MVFFSSLSLATLHSIHEGISTGSLVCSRGLGNFPSTPILCKLSKSYESTCCSSCFYPVCPFFAAVQISNAWHQWTTAKWNASVCTFMLECNHVFTLLPLSATSKDHRLWPRSTWLPRCSWKLPSLRREIVASLCDDCIMISHWSLMLVIVGWGKRTHSLPELLALVCRQLRCARAHDSIRRRDVDLLGPGSRTLVSNHWVAPQPSLTRPPCPIHLASPPMHPLNIRWWLLGLTYPPPTDSAVPDDETPCSSAYGHPLSPLYLTLDRPWAL